MRHIWLKFEFQLPEYLMLELTGKHFSCSEHISWEAFWLRIYFSGQRLFHQLRRTIKFPEMLRFKCQFEKYAEIYMNLLFTHYINF